MTEELRKKLATGDLATRLAEHVEDRLRLSRSAMSQSYDDWDYYDAVYRGVKQIRDTEDRRAREAKQPEKWVLPLGYAQVQSFVSFAFSLLFQREYFFELIGNSPEAEESVHTVEALLQRELDKNRWPVLLYQFLLDVARFGIGVLKCSWETEQEQVRVPAAVLDVDGETIQPGRWQTVTRIISEGNKIEVISPYHFFPDPRVPLNRLNDGEFVGHGVEFFRWELQSMERAGLVTGVDKIPHLTISLVETGEMRDLRYSAVQEALNGGAKGNRILVDEVQIRLDPKEFGLPEESDRWLVWVANGTRVIRLEALPYKGWTYFVGQFGPDNNHFLNEGLLSCIDAMQDVASWLVNSHIASVRRTIENRLVVDPEGVNMDDLKNHRAVIRLVPGASRTGIDRWIKQLTVTDTTANHMNDAEILHQFIQVTTGISENFLGQFAPGRRSATEARNVATLASARQKMIVMLLYYNALEPLGRAMLENLRRWMTLPTYVRILGTGADPFAWTMLKQVEAGTLRGHDYDFRFFDSTLPSEKAFMAETLKEVLIALAQQERPVVQLDLNKLLLEIMLLKGIKYPQRFYASGNGSGAIGGPVPGIGPGGAPVPPGPGPVLP